MNPPRQRSSGPADEPRYGIGEVIGSGGMGEVRAAVDNRLGRDVAVKVLRSDLAVDDSVRSRFEHEARAAAGLTHPNIVTVFDTGELDGVPFIVMERLPGRTLRDEMDGGPMPEARVMEVARDCLSALEAAHAVGVVHRDIKPGNILVAEDGTAKLADFGIAKSTDGLDHTRTGEVLGTPMYLAPERLEGAPATPGSDLYSLGVLLYEALTGEAPFEGSNPVAVAAAVRSTAPPPLTARRPALRPALAQAIDRAMARDPAARFTDAAEMAAALAALTTGPEIAATTGADETVAAAVEPPTPTVPLRTRPAALGDREEPRRQRGASPGGRRPGPSPARLQQLSSWWSSLGRRRETVLAAAVVVVIALLVVVALVEDDPGPASEPAPAGERMLPPELDDAVDRLEESVQP